MKLPYLLQSNYNVCYSGKAIVQLQCILLWQLTVDVLRTSAVDTTLHCTQLLYEVKEKQP